MSGFLGRLFGSQQPEGSSNALVPVNDTPPPFFSTPSRSVRSPRTTRSAGGRGTVADWVGSQGWLDEEGCRRPPTKNTWSGCSRGSLPTYLPKQERVCCRKTQKSRAKMSQKCRGRVKRRAEACRDKVKVYNAATCRCVKPNIAEMAHMADGSLPLDYYRPRPRPKKRSSGKRKSKTSKRKRKVHKGPRGGKYVLRKGKKVYLSSSKK